MKYKEFLRVAALLNESLGIAPLLYGSLGLERRLDADLGADDIDVLIPERFLQADWPRLTALMERAGYVLYDPEEHAFLRDGASVAFASLENLRPFALVDPEAIPLIEDGGVRYLLLELGDYLKVYEASSLDGYRKDVRHKEDQAKIERIRSALSAR